MRPLVCSCYQYNVNVGAGGCSAAYFIKDLMGETVKVDVYSNDKVGGRIAVVEYGGRQYEAGASILHKDNQYMAGFAHMFGEWEFISYACTCMCSCSVSATVVNHGSKIEPSLQKSLVPHSVASMLPKSFVMSIPNHTEMFRDSHHLL